MVKRTESALFLPYQGDLYTVSGNYENGESCIGLSTDYTG